MNVDGSRNGVALLTFGDQSPLYGAIDPGLRLILPVSRCGQDPALTFFDGVNDAESKKKNAPTHWDRSVEILE